jgi:hypothetical protein
MFRPFYYLEHTLRLPLGHNAGLDLVKAELPCPLPVIEFRLLNNLLVEGFVLLIAVVMKNCIW